MTTKQRYITMALSGLLFGWFLGDFILSHKKSKEEFKTVYSMIETTGPKKETFNIQEAAQSYLNLETEKLSSEAQIKENCKFAYDEATNGNVKVYVVLESMKYIQEYVEVAKQVRPYWYWSNGIPYWKGGSTN